MSNHEMTKARPQGRAPDQLRGVSIELGAMAYPEGSALITCGKTKVLVAASVEKRVPRFLIDKQQGWITAEYAMLPRATHTRSSRELSQGGRPSGRSSEIQRLIGRSLRSIVNLGKLPEVTITLDCDVLQADGGTRTAAITGAYVALVEALSKMLLAGDLKSWPLEDSVAAVSVGLLGDEPRLDLEYTEDSRAQVDMNVVATGRGHLVEVQGTGELRSFTRAEHDGLVDLALAGIRQLSSHQDEALEPVMTQVEATLERRQRPPATPRDERELWDRPSSD